MAGTVKININHADNEVIAILNGTIVYDKKTEGDPAFADVVDITALMRAGDNTLVLIGVNWGGPANFQGSVVAGNLSLPFNWYGASTPNGMCWNQVFNLSY